MCIRGSFKANQRERLVALCRRAGASDAEGLADELFLLLEGCLLYTSGAAHERSRVDLGGPRIIQKKKQTNTHTHSHSEALKDADATTHTDTQRSKRRERTDVGMR